MDLQVSSRPFQGEVQADNLERKARWREWGCLSLSRQNATLLAPPMQQPPCSRQSARTANSVDSWRGRQATGHRMLPFPRVLAFLVKRNHISVPQNKVPPHQLSPQRSELQLWLGCDAGIQVPAKLCAKMQVTLAEGLFVVIRSSHRVQRGTDLFVCLNFCGFSSCFLFLFSFWCIQ